MDGSFNQLESDTYLKYELYDSSSSHYKEKKVFLKKLSNTLWLMFLISYKWK